MHSTMQILPPFILGFIGYVWSQRIVQEEAGLTLFQVHPQLVLFAVGFGLSTVSTQMVVLHMTKSHLPLFPSHLYFITLPLFFGLFVPPQYLDASTYVIVSIVTCYHLLFAVSSVNEICDYLKIKAFRIDTKTEVKKAT